MQFIVHKQRERHRDRDQDRHRDYILDITG